MGRSDRRGPGDASLHLADGVALLRPEEQVFQAMLDGWRNQQLSRNLGFGTVNAREAIVRHFHAFAGSEPWEWSAADVDEFFMQCRAIHGLAQSTLLGYQLALRAFLAYLVDPAYGWSEACEERFGTHPTQVCHEWNTARHTQDAIARPKKRALTWEEVQDLFDHADNRVERILAQGRKGAIPAFRDAVLLKVAYAWGLRRNEVRMLDTIDFGFNPKAPSFGRYGVLYVRYGKAMKGAPPKRRSVLTVPEMDWAVESLVQWIEDIRPRVSGEDNPALWCTERSSRIALGSVSNTFNQFRKELGLASGIDFHSLRRSYVSHLIEYGYEARFVQEQVGHEHASTTSIYTHVSSDYRTRVVQNAFERVAERAVRQGSNERRNRESTS